MDLTISVLNSHEIFLVTVLTAIWADSLILSHCFDKGFTQCFGYTSNRRRRSNSHHCRPANQRAGHNHVTNGLSVIGWWRRVIPALISDQKLIEMAKKSNKFARNCSTELIRGFSELIKPITALMTGALSIEVCCYCCACWASQVCLLVQWVHSQPT